MANEKVGGWELAEMQSCSLPEKVATGFLRVTQGLVGTTHIPVLYAGKQVVNGVNHMIICKQIRAAQGAPAHLVKMVLHQAPDESAIEGKWSLLTIDEIV